MEPIQLKMKPKIWLYVFIIFYVYASILVIFVKGVHSLPLLLLITFCAAVIVTGVIMGIFYFSQKEVILNDQEIKRIGKSSSTSIAYNDIKVIKVGWGSFSIFDEGKDAINITILQSNFSLAKELLNKKIEDRTDIQIKGLKLFINKYITTNSSYT